MTRSGNTSIGYDLSLVIVNPDGENVLYDTLINADSYEDGLSYSYSVKNHRSTTTNFGIADSNYYGHVRCINALNQTSYKQGFVLSAYQGYLLNNSINTIQNSLLSLPKIEHIETQSDSGYKFINVNFVSSLGSIQGFITSDNTLVYFTVDLSHLSSSLSDSYTYFRNITGTFVDKVSGIHNSDSTYRIKFDLDLSSLNNVIQSSNITFLTTDVRNVKVELSKS